MLKTLISTLTIFIFSAHLLFAQFGTKGIIELDNGTKIKPQRIETSNYVILGMDNFSTDSTNLLSKSIKIFDKNSKEIHSESYKNQGKDYNIVSKEYNVFGDLIRKKEKRDGKPEKVSEFQYEYDTLKNWILKTEFIFNDTLKFKNCSTRKIEYRTEEIEKYKDTLLSIISSHQCYGPVKAIYYCERRGNQNLCGVIDQQRKTDEYFINEDFLEIEFISKYKGEKKIHRKYITLENGKKIEDILNRSTKSFSIDSIQTDKGIEVFKKTEENGEIISESHFKYNKNKDELSKKTKSFSSYSFNQDISYQYLEYNK